MAIYDLDLIKKLTGIEDDEIASFYADAVICKIEKMLGYSLAEATQTDYIKGVGTSYAWLLRKPVSNISEVKYNDSIIESEEYSERNLKNTPHLIFDDICPCPNEEIEVENTAGYKEFGTGEPQLDPCITALIAGAVQAWASQVENGGLDSYKIDTISYKFTQWMDSSQAFYTMIYDTFGVAI